MKSFMALNQSHSTPEGPKTIQSDQKLKGALYQCGGRAHARGQRRVISACALDAHLSTQKPAHLLIRRIN
jgi:hypothetical protein